MYIPSRLAPSIGGIVGVDSVAITIFLPITSHSLLSAVITNIVFLSLNLASPYTICTLLAFKSLEIPSTNSSIIFCFLL